MVAGGYLEWRRRVGWGRKQREVCGEVPLVEVGDEGLMWMMVVVVVAHLALELLWGWVCSG